jgi:hypothetical protein
MRVYKQRLNVSAMRLNMKVRMLLNNTYPTRHRGCIYQKTAIGEANAAKSKIVIAMNITRGSRYGKD